MKIRLQQADAARVEIELPHPDGRRRALCLTELKGASGGIERVAAGPTGGEVRVRQVRAASAVVEHLEWPLGRGARLTTASPAALAGLALDLDVPGGAARAGDGAPLSGRMALTRAGGRGLTLELGAAAHRVVLDIDALASAVELSPERIGYASAERIELGDLQTALAGWLLRASGGALERARADWRDGELLLGAGGAHLAGLAITADGVSGEIDRIEMPQGMRTSGRALVIPELMIPEARVAVDDVVEAIRRRLPARAPAPARAVTDSGRFRFDFGFLDRLTGRVDVDLTMELSVPVIGKREATHHFRIPIVGGAVNYRELERDLAGIEDAFIDLEVRGRSLVIERRIPLLGMEKPLVVWDLSPDELELARKRLVNLRTIPRMQIMRSGGGGEKGPIAVRGLHFGDIEIQLALAPGEEGAEGDEGEVLDGLAVATLRATGELTYQPQREPAPTRAELAIERIAAGPFELAVGGARIEVDRVEVAAVDGEVEFHGLRPRAGRLVARGALLRNLKIIAGGALLLLALLAACGGDDGGAPPPGGRADARASADAGPALDARIGVDCRGADCAPDEACCGDRIEPPHIAYYCLADEVAGECDQSFDCDGPEDCASGLCCGGERIECAPVGARSCPDGAPVCHSAADCGVGPCCPTPSGVVKECITPCPAI